MSLTFQGIHADILADTTTPELCVLGARGSGKTTVCVYKELKLLVEHPKLKTFLFRFSDKDTQKLLVPFFRAMCMDEFNQKPEWDDDESCFVFENGAMAFMFGIQATSQRSRYGKLRGLEVARCFSEQAEELATDLGLELRAAIRQPGFRHLYQLTYCANPPPQKHWLVTQFPRDNRIKNRKLFSLSVYQNAHHLAPDFIEGMERAFSVKHPKHRTMILGLPGVNVTGEPVYGDLFKPDLHIRTLAYDPKLPLLEAFDFGRLNPCWVVAQRPYAGGLRWLGGILAQEMFLEDFLPIVTRYRDEWFPHVEGVKTCCTLSGSEETPGQIGIRELRAAGFIPRWKAGSNSPDVVLSLIERQAQYLRRRGADGQELFGVNDDDTHWLTVSNEGIEASPFMAQAYGGGYAWADKSVSVGRNEMKQPVSDDWFEYPMRAAEALELNFNMTPTDAELAKRRANAARPLARALAASPMDWAR